MAETNRYARRRQSGVCNRCSQPSRRAYCPACAALYQDRRRELKTRGICPSCRLRPVAPGMAKCESCLLAARAAAERLREARRQAGLCLFCGAARTQGRTLCRPCHDKHAARVTRRRKGREAE